MKNSDHIYNKLESVEKHYKSLTYPNDDMRRDFYGMVSNSIRTFYAGHISAELSLYIESGKVSFVEEMISHRKHIDCLMKIYSTSDNPINSLNSALIIACWTSFEMAITTISSHVLPDKTKSELSLNDYAKACKILKSDENIKQETLDLLKEKFSVNHLTHVQTWRKFSELVKFAEKSNKKYSRIRQDDIKFITLYGDMRNCLMHANGVYHGNSSRTEPFKDYEIKLESGKQFTYRPEKELPEFHIDLITALSDIFTALTLLYNDIDFISYPDIETL